MTDLNKLIDTLGEVPFWKRSDLADLPTELQIRQTIALESIATSLADLMGEAEDWTGPREVTQ